MPCQLSYASYAVPAMLCPLCYAVPAMLRWARYATLGPLCYAGPAMLCCASYAMPLKLTQIDIELGPIQSIESDRELNTMPLQPVDNDQFDVLGRL